MAMTGISTGNIAFVASAIIALAACSTASRTERQLDRIGFSDFPDIPAASLVPPARPRTGGLEYSSNTLIISYDMDVGRNPLLKAIKKYKASIIHDYSIINAIAIRIPEDKTLDESIVHFESVRGVIQVSEDRIDSINDPLLLPL